MASPTTLPVARLRAAGCKVNTVIGHDPNIGDFIYSVRLPDDFGDLRTQSPDKVRLRQASAYVPRHSDGKHLIVQACAYRRGLKTPKGVAAQYHHDVADLLAIVAQSIEETQS